MQNLVAHHVKGKKALFVSTRHNSWISHYFSNEYLQRKNFILNIHIYIYIFGIMQRVLMKTRIFSDFLKHQNLMQLVIRKFQNGPLRFDVWNWLRWIPWHRCIMHRIWNRISTKTGLADLLLLLTCIQIYFETDK